MGNSNIDFRSKRDEDNLALFHPWKKGKDFGTMGNLGFKLKEADKKKLFEPIKDTVTQKELEAEVPDPRTYSTMVYYKKKHIEPRHVTLYESERLAQLDESAKGKEAYTGDSMMIADNTKQRKRKAHKFSDRNDRLQKEFAKKNLIIDKKERNQEAEQETQLVKINTKPTLADNIDLSKIKEIRHALRRRYASRKDLRKIFKEWDFNGTGDITMFDAKRMINLLGIPINYNESVALIASSNKRRNGSLNLAEFMHLIFSDNPALNIDLKNIEYKEEQSYASEADLENIKASMDKNMHMAAIEENSNFLKDHLRNRIPIITRLLVNKGMKGKSLNLEDFYGVLEELKLPDKYLSEDVLRRIQQEFPSSQEEGNIDHGLLFKTIIQNKADNDFFAFKDKVYSHLENKIKNSSAKLLESQAAIKADEEAKHKLMKELEKAEKLSLAKMQTKNEKYASHVGKKLNASQPSEDFMNQVYKDRQKHFERHLQLENNLSANPMFFSDSSKRTRFGCKPSHKDTFSNIQAGPGSGMFISERDRFDKRLNNLSLLERQEKHKVREDKSKRIGTVNKEYADMRQRKDHVAQEKQVYSLLQRTIKMQKYEQINKLRNELIE